jgi:hypothetical protein
MQDNGGFQLLDSIVHSPQAQPSCQRPLYASWEVSLAIHNLA